jgi:hypothetical protein
VGIHHARFLNGNPTHEYRHYQMCAVPGCPQRLEWTSVVSWVGLSGNRHLHEAGWRQEQGRWVCPHHPRG